MTPVETVQTRTPHAVPATADLDKLAQIFVHAFPKLDSDDQKLAVKLYQLLAEGEWVSRDRLAHALDRPVGAVADTLNSWPGVFYDEAENIIGFWGLSVKETQHRLDVNGTSVYAWCAWDTLFIPELLNITASITSTCAATREEIKLSVSPLRVEAVEPSDVVMSFLVPDEKELRENITTSFCHFVYFFRSREDGEAWISQHEGGFFLSLEEAFKVGKNMNAARYKETLGK